MSRVAVVACVICVAACSAASDAPSSVDAGLVDDAPDLPVDAYLPAYETVPPCTDPAFWELPPNYDGRITVFPACPISEAQPLMPFSLRARVAAGAELFERVCYRITESRDAGWSVGAVIERDPMTGWDGYVAGRQPHLAFELRGIFPGGRLAAVQRGSVDSSAFIELASTRDVITSVTSTGRYATATRVVLGGDTVVLVSDLRALFSVEGRPAWIEPAGARASLAAAGPIERVTFDADPSRVRTAESGRSTLIVMGTRLWTPYTLFGVTPSIGILEREIAPLEAAPDQLVGSETHPVLARLGDRVVAVDAVGVTIDPLFASGTDAIVDGHRPHLLRAAMLVPIDFDTTVEPAALRAREDQAFPVDPRIGEPLFVLEDGRVLGTDGIVGRPREQSPDFLSAVDALGGPVRSFARASFDGSMRWGFAAVARTDDYAVLSFGQVEPHMCGF